MRTTEHTTKTPSATAGFFAMLCRSLSTTGTIAPSRAPRVLAFLFTALAALAFTAVPAVAGTIHVLSGTFAGSGASALSEPLGVAVNDESGDVYVVDAGHDRVEEFNAAGTVVLGEFNGSAAPTGVFSNLGNSTADDIAVDNCTNSLTKEPCTTMEDPSVGDVYVTDPGHKVVDQFSSSGAYLGQLTGTCEKGGEPAPSCPGSKFVAFGYLVGVAVDAEGNVWVAENASEDHGVLAQFSDTGAFLKAINIIKSISAGGIALDSAGGVYVVLGGGTIGKFDAATGVEVAQTQIKEHTEEEDTGVAVDPSTGDLFIVNFPNLPEAGAGTRRIEEYSEAVPSKPFSTLLETFPAEKEGAAEERLAFLGGITVTATGTVYASQRGRDSVEMYNEVVVPEVSIEPVSKLKATSVTLNGVVNPEGAEVASCEFEYGTSSSYGQTAQCVPAPGSGTSPVPVKASLTGLAPGIVYHYRLIATNPDHQTAATPDKQFTTRGPAIAEEQVTGVEQTAATLQAQIDPNETATSYHFEYDTREYKEGEGPHGTSLPVPSAPLGAGSSSVPVAATPEGLQPGTTYYYRVVAESEPLGTPETFDGPDKSFTTNAPPSTTPQNCPNEQLRAEQPDASVLPDCRAYEMVSPLAKDGNGVLTNLGRAAESGESIAYFSPGSFAEPKSTLLDAPYLSRRESGSWATQNLSPPDVDYVGANETTVFDFEELLFTQDLSRGVVATPFQSLASGQPIGYSNLYVADTETGSYETVTAVQPEAEYNAFQESDGGQGIPEAAGASNDLSHVVFQQKAGLTAGASPGHNHVYEEAGGVLRQVDVPPPGGKLEGEDHVGSAATGALYGDGDPWRAVSGSGSSVVFTGGEPLSSFAGASVAGQVYVRENPMSVEDCSVVGDACTVEVSASQRTNAMGHPEPDPNAGKGPIAGTASYRDASVDGSRVFFTSRVELTNHADTGPEDHYANLYEYNVETGVLSDFTPESAEGGRVLGLVTAGENAGEENSYVYFVANGVLASNENANKERAQPGSCKEEQGEKLTGEHTCSLYVAHYSGGKWETEFVATLAGGDISGGAVEGDESDWIGFEGGGLDYDYGPAAHSARVTPDGTTLAFESERDLTNSYDNRQAAGGKCGSAGRCSEVYLFDAATGKLICASCDPDGSRPVGSARLSEGFAGSSYIPRNLSQSGGRLFFETPNALVPHDSDGLVNVYEWERPATPEEAAKGENSCTSSSPDFHVSNEGCVFPISNVAGDYDSSFMDASASGNDVFVLTVDQLVPSDTDDRGDVYDVKVGGGFPVTVAPPVCTNADSCKPPLSPQPGVFGVPASATFSGPGNATPAVAPPSPVKTVTKKTVKCRKGFVKKKVRKKDECVKLKSKSRAKKSAHTNRRAGR